MWIGGVHFFISPRLRYCGLRQQVGEGVDRAAGEAGGAGFAGELIEEGVFAVVGGPDGEIVVPGDAALGGFPEEAGVGVFGEFVEADVAAVHGHGLGVGGKGNDAGAVIELDDADFEVVGEGGRPAGIIEAIDGEDFLAVANDRAGEVEDFGELVALPDVFEGAGIVFGDEEVIAFGEAEAFADVFEGVGGGPADADGFFGEGENGLTSGVDRVLGLDPIDLVRHEVSGEARIGLEAEGREVHGTL